MSSSTTICTAMPDGSRVASGIPPAVHPDDLTGDVRRFVAAEERARGGDVLGQSGTANRRPRSSSAMPPSPNSPRASDARSMGVSMKPGGIALTVMPRGPTSRAKDFVSPLSPDFEDT